MLYFVVRSSIPDFGENIITRHVCVTDASLTSVTGTWPSRVLPTTKIFALEATCWLYKREFTFCRSISSVDVCANINILVRARLVCSYKQNFKHIWSRANTQTTEPLFLCMRFTRSTSPLFLALGKLSYPSGYSCAKVKLRRRWSHKMW